VTDRSGRTEPPGDPGRPPGLAVLGLRVGEPVRWRTTGNGRWRHGTVEARRADGLVAIASPAIAGPAMAEPSGTTTASTVAAAVEVIQVRAAGIRGGGRWEPLAVRASRCVQLVLPFALT
jgi:hypothetical protein